MTSLLLALKLLCVSELGVTIHINALAIDQETYQVKLHNAHLEPMNVDRQEIGFDQHGEMIKIETSYLWEALTVEKKEGKWSGLYMYDLGYYPLECSILN